MCISAAFCFYNLSSIVNGLVYFDQFSLIPPMHLALVILGIFVLLGGVWVVSVQSGGGGVDVGAWSEEDDLSEDLLIEECGPSDLEDGHGTSESNDAVVEESIGRKRDCAKIGPVPMERETRSESNVASMSTSPKVMGLGLDLGLDRPSRPQPTISQSVVHRVLSPLAPEREPLLSDDNAHAIQLSPPSIRRASHRRRLTGEAYTQNLSYAHNIRVSSHTLPHSAHTPASPPLLPLNGVATLGAGFQIGLSPVSPGFAIVPRERGRRVSGMGTGTGSADVVDSTAGGQVQGRRRRRTVSEGDVRGREVACEPGDEGLEEGRQGKWGWLKVFISR